MVSISTHHLQNTIISHFAQSSWLLFSLKKECSTSCNNVINKKISSQNLNENVSLIYNVFSRTTGFTCMWRALQGFWYFAEIKAKFRGKKVIILGKIGQFCGIFAREKSKFAEKSADFAILAKKSQISKDFQGQILRKIGQFHGKFQGETSPRNNQ